MLSSLHTYNCVGIYVSFFLYLEVAGVGEGNPVEREAVVVCMCVYACENYWVRPRLVID